MPRSSTTLPSVSVVVPSYNQGRFLRACLESIFRQEYPRLEVVVMDGGSTDNSTAVIRSFSPRLKFWRSGPDGGQSAAINDGVRRCTGDVVAWLNSDDYYWGDCLWTVGRAWAAHPGHGLYLGNGFRYSQENDAYTPFNRRHMALNRRALQEGLDYILQPAAFFSRAAWERAGGLDPKLRYCMDWDLLIRISRDHAAVLINEFLAVSREYAETKTSAGRMARAHEILGMLRRHTAQEITPGGLYFLLETLLAETDSAALAAVRGPLYEGMKALRTCWEVQVGNADGFPEQGDTQDVTYLPYVVADAAPAPGETDGLPSVSIVVPSFNQAAFLPQTLDSLFGQQYPGLETVVMDGGSTDGSQDILRRYESRLAGWVSERDRGPAHAINKGFARTRGDVVAWLASDDVLAHGAIREAARLFAQDPELDLVYGNALYIDQQGELFLADHGSCRTGLYYGDMQSPERIPAYWSYVHAVPQPTVFFRRRLLERCGPLDESYKFIFDFELFFRFARAAKVKKIERTQAFYRIHAGSKTSSWDDFLVELYRFSRPLWPRRSDPAFWPTLRAFLGNYLNRRCPGASRLRRRLHGARVALSVWSGWGNPEQVGRRRHPRAAPPAPVPTPDGAGAAARPVERAEPAWTSFFCAFVWPMHPGRCGGEIRDFHLLRRLLSFSRVTYYSYLDVVRDGRANPLARHVEDVHTPNTLRRVRPGLPGVPTAPPSLPRRAVDWLRRRGWPVLGPRYHMDATDKIPRLQAHLLPALVDDLAHESPDFLFVGPQVNPAAMLMPDVSPRTRRILASYDVESIRMARLAAARRGWPRRLAGALEARRAEAFERDNLALYDGVIAVSELDKELFVARYGVPAERILVAPNAVDPDFFAFAPRPAGAGRLVLFAASLGYEPNHKAALRLIDRIMPLVRREHPDAAVWVVGQSPPADLAARHDGSRVVVAGDVPDVRPYLASASVSCVPLLAGSGTKYKVLEALSAGVPIVCSPIGAEGLDLADGEEILIGRTDAELAAAVSRVLSDRDLARRLARQGRARVEARYCWDAALSGLGAWLAALAAMPRRKQDQEAGRRDAAPVEAEKVAA